MSMNRRIPTAALYLGLLSLEASVQRALSEPQTMAKAVDNALDLPGNADLPADVREQLRTEAAQEIARIRGQGGVPQAMAKAVTSDLIQDIVKEDLEPYAHNTLWHESNPNELTILKLAPSTNATRVTHEYDRIDSYSDDRGFGFFGEQTLPRETQPGFSRHVTNIRLMGETSTTYLLASLQKTINVEGETSAQGIAKRMLTLSILKKKNRAIYFSDTSVTRLGSAGARFQGLLQQIREGTDGTVGSSPYGSHVIDMRGAPLTLDNIRPRIAKAIGVWGMITSLIMDQYVRADMETYLDGAQRMNLPLGSSALMLGQNVGGIRSQGNDIVFHTDTALGPNQEWKRYTGVAERGAPTSAPTVSAAAVTDTDSYLPPGAYTYIVTEIKDDRESLGATVTVTISENEKARLTVSPSDSTSDSYRVYRKLTSETGEPYLAFEVALVSAGQDIDDIDLYMPNTSVVFGLAIRSASAEMLSSVVPSGARTPYAAAQLESASFLNMKDNPQNTVTMANLGPAMGVMNLANIVPSVARPLVYSAFAPQMRNPLHNLAFINVGSRTAGTAVE